MRAMGHQSGTLVFFSGRASYCGAFSDRMLLRQAMMSLASAPGSVVKGAVC